MNDILTKFVRSHCGKKTMSEEYLHSLVTAQHMKFEENVLQNKSLKQLAVTGK
jgi:hypothetical protein